MLLVGVLVAFTLMLVSILGWRVVGICIIFLDVFEFYLVRDGVFGGRSIDIGGWRGGIISLVVGVR